MIETGTTASGDTPGPESPGRLVLVAWLIAAAAAVAFRFWYASFRPLLPDEAYYWVWTRHLSTGYFDHPPMVAYLIAASMRLFGQGEVGVRGLGILLMAAAVALTLHTACAAGVGPRGRMLLLAIWLTSPLLAGLATMMSPDTPAAFFAAAAVAVAVSIARRVDRAEPVTMTAWLALGASLGLAVASKYTAALTAIAIAAAFMTDARGRRLLRTPGPYAAFLVAGLVFTPVVVWNARHDWVSFRFQLSHGLDAREANSARGLALFVVEQAGMWTPVLFALGVAALASCWRTYRRLPLTVRLLTWAATVPLALFAAAATRTHGEGNWPDLAYFPMSVVIVRFVSLDWQSRARTAWVGCVVAMAAATVVQFPEVIRASGFRMPGALRKLYGWRELGAELGRVEDGVDLIYADHMQDAGEIAFYMPGRPPVWFYRPAGRRPSAFEFFEGQPDPRRAKRVLFVGDHSDAFCRDFGFVVERRGYWEHVHGGRTPKQARAYCVLGRKGDGP